MRVGGEQEKIGKGNRKKSFQTIFLQLNSNISLMTTAGGLRAKCQHECFRWGFCF